MHDFTNECERLAVRLSSSVCRGVRATVDLAFNEDVGLANPGRIAPGWGLPEAAPSGS